MLIQQPLDFLYIMYSLALTAGNKDCVLITEDKYDLMDIGICFARRQVSNDNVEYNCIAEKCAIEAAFAFICAHKNEVALPVLNEQVEYFQKHVRYEGFITSHKGFVCKCTINNIN